MKKKKILEVKPLKRNSEEMCARAAVKILEHEKTLIVWVYDEGDTTVPTLTIACTKTEYALYDMDYKKWTTRAMDNLYNHSENYTDAEMTDEDLEKVKRFLTKKKKPYINYRFWSDWIDQKRIDMRWEQNHKMHEKRMERLRDRCESLLEIPTEFEHWVFEQFKFTHTLTYTKKGRNAKVTCSRCGKTVEYIFEKITYEDEARRFGEKPYHNKRGVCMECGAEGIYRAEGKYKGVCRQTRNAFMIQPTKVEGRMVVRYFNIDMIQAAEFEEISLVEIARGYIENGKKKMQIDYHKHSIYRDDFWDDCNLSGMRNIKIKPGLVYPKTMDYIKQSGLKYCALEMYVDRFGDNANIIGYISTYNIFPGLEILTKMGLYSLVHELTKRYTLNSYIDITARKPQDVLRIEKQKLNKLRIFSGSTNLLKVLQFEKEHNLHLKEEVENWYTFTFNRVYEYENILRFMTMEKFKNYVEKIAKVGENKGEVAQLYLDYLNLRDRLGYDMTNTVYLYPRDLRTQHNNLVEIENKQKQDKKKAEKEEKYPNIRQQFKKLNKKYKYKYKGLFIRPCKSASEIVDEGRIQHHCVGGDNYLEKHNKGETYILVLRKIGEEETPFVTVEIKPDAEVEQWYGAYDKKNNEEVGLVKEEVDEWLKKYTLMKKEKLLNADEQVMQFAG